MVKLSSLFRREKVNFTLAPNLGWEIYPYMFKPLIEENTICPEKSGFCLVNLLRKFANLLRRIPRFLLGRLYARSYYL